MNLINTKYLALYIHKLLPGINIDIYDTYITLALKTRYLVLDLDNGAIKCKSYKDEVILYDLNHSDINDNSLLLFLSNVISEEEVTYLLRRSQ